MKIKGITKGKLKGRPIEFEPAEKPPHALYEAVAKKAPEGAKWWPTDIKVTSFTFNPRGPGGKNKKGFADNTYFASGTFMHHTHNMVKDKYYGAKPKTFHLEFEDCLDSVGQPDLKTTKLDIT